MGKIKKKTTTNKPRSGRGGLTSKSASSDLAQEPRPISYDYRSKQARKEEYLKYKAKYPWSASFRSARSRCSDIKRKNYKHYGGKGIKLLMTLNDFKFLWFRDKAYLMNKPSIDRMDSNGDYCIENCQFIEYVLNCSKVDRSNIKKICSKPVLQLDDAGNIIKRYSSLHEAWRTTKISWQNIWKCVHSIRPKAGGFRWKYAN